MFVHKPVLLEPTLSLLNLAAQQSASVLVDATLGEGGHGAAFLAAAPQLTLCGVEKDGEILSRARKRLAPYGGRVRLFNSCFSDFFERYEQLVDRKPDRIFFDLGVSMFHYQLGARGFSFSRDEPLDMRLDATRGRSAADIVNTVSEVDLRKMIRNYGEERLAAQISRAIVRERNKSEIHSSKALADVVWKAVPPSYRYGRAHPATRTFQALRIVVNNELEVLAATLPKAFDLLNSGGRMAVISFHSLEDRIVKRFFQECNKSCTCPPESPICYCGGRKRARIVTRKPVRATQEEISRNPASRSAGLRVLEKIE